MKFKLILLFVFTLLSHFAYSSCSISGEDDVTVPAGGTQEVYTLNASSCNFIKSVSFSGSSSLDATISDANCTSFIINFQQKFATGDVVVTYVNPAGGTATCRFSITTRCERVDPEISVASPLCGTTDVNVSILVDDSVGPNDFTMLTGVTVVSISTNGKTINAVLSLDEGCDPVDASFCYYNFNKCGDFQISCASVPDWSNVAVGGFSQGAESLCLTGQSTGSIYELSNVQNNDSECVDIIWTATPSNGASVFYNQGSPVALVGFYEPGTYVVRAEVIACGISTLRSRTVVVSSSVPNLPVNPPYHIEWLCFPDPDQYCLNVGSGASDLVVSANTNGIGVSSNGPNLCITDLWGFSQTPTVYITPSNACGDGASVAWDIYINDPDHCGFGDGGLREMNIKEDFIIATVNQVPIRFDLEMEDQVVTKSYLEIFDLQGRLIASKTFTGEHPNLTSNDLPRGVLLARLTQNNKTYVNKFVH